MKTILFSTLLGSVLVASGLAQSEINRRRENQQDRIANGIASGKLSAGEAARLEKKEAAINREVAAERKANGGNLTNKQKRQVNRQQNRVSRQIYRDKHN